MNGHGNYQTIVEHSGVFRNHKNLSRHKRCECRGPRVLQSFHRLSGSALVIESTQSETENGIRAVFREWLQRIHFAFANIAYGRSAHATAQGALRWIDPI